MAITNGTKTPVIKNAPTKIIGNPLGAGSGRPPVEGKMYPRGAPKKG